MKIEQKPWLDSTKPVVEIKTARVNFIDGLAKAAVEKKLQLLPEVTWDRWAGDLDNMGIFGWVAREDGKADFVLLRFELGELYFFTTSSARYSKEFGQRLGFDTAGHKPCKRVEDFFTNVKAVKL